MFIIYAIIIGILLGYTFGGKLRNLTNMPLKRNFLIFCGLFIQLIIFSELPFINQISQNMISILHIISYICIIIFIIINVSIPGILIIGLGSLLNSFVIFLNRGYMPSITANSIDNNVAEISSNTLFPWLGDIFRLPDWLPLTNSFSIGDILIAIGVCFYLTLNMRPNDRRQYN